MAGDGEISLSVRRTDIIQHSLRSEVLVGLGFAVERLPQLICLREALLDSVIGEGVVDVSS